MASKEVLAAKEEQVEAIKSKISAAKSIVIIDYMGLTVAEDTAFRKDLRTAGVDYKVLKNRLVKRAFNELGMTQFDEALNGPSAVAFSDTDAVAPAKIIVDSIKKLNKMKAKCGMSRANISTRRVSKPSPPPPRERSSSRRCSAACSRPSPSSLCA